MADNTPVPIDPPVIIHQPDLNFTSMTIQVMSVTLGVSASFIIFLYNGGRMISTRNYTMSGEDYTNWGNDDQYVYTWVAIQLRAE